MTTREALFSVLWLAKIGLAVWTCDNCNHVVYSQASRCPACGKLSPIRKSSSEVLERVAQCPTDDIYCKHIDGEIFSMSSYEWANKAPAQQDLTALPDYRDPNSDTVDAIKKAKYFHQSDDVEYWDSTFGKSEDIEPPIIPAEESQTTTTLQSIGILSVIVLCTVLILLLLDFLIHETQFLVAAQSIVGLIAVFGLFSIFGRLFFGNEDEEDHDLD